MRRVALLVISVCLLTGVAGYADTRRPSLLPHEAIAYSSDMDDPNPMPPFGTPLHPGKNIDIYSLWTRDQFRLTSEIDNEQFAVWSPDGTKIAFEGSREVGPSGVDYDIYVMDADGSNLTRLTNNPAFDAVPAWSPDGQQISFTSFRTGDPEIYVMDADDGTGLQRITKRPGWDFAFGNWCPDGRIVFHSDRGEPELPIEPLPLRTFDVYVMDAEGKNVVQLTDDPANDDDAVCSPDGSKIVFSSERDECVDTLPIDCAVRRDLYVMDIDGSNEVQITSGGGSEHRSVWSPDGRRIAFDTDVDGNLEIYVMDPDGTDLARLTNDPAYDFHPVFRP